MNDRSLPRVRCASPADAQGVLAIYAPIVRETAISFELTPPTLEEMRSRIVRTIPTLPWLVCESRVGIGGYAYASRHRERPAYQWAVDVSVYVEAQSRGKGVARTLYTSLLGMLADLGYYTGLAGIALPNPGSVGLHEAMGFRPIGIYRNIGYKLGSWRDVGWWQCQLRECDADPEPPRTMQEYSGSSAMLSRLAEH